MSTKLTGAVSKYFLFCFVLPQTVDGSKDGGGFCQCGVKLSYFKENFPLFDITLCRLQSPDYNNKHLRKYVDVWQISPRPSSLLLSSVSDRKPPGFLLSWWWPSHLTLRSYRLLLWWDSSRRNSRVRLDVELSSQLICRPKCVENSVGFVPAGFRQGRSEILRTCHVTGQWK